MKNLPTGHDTKLLQLLFTHLQIATANQSTGECTEAITCHYRCNTDGSIRWVWPVANRHPDFLRFYHRSHWKAHAFVAAAKLSFFLRCPKAMAQGTIQMFTNKEGSDLLQQKMGDRWALFTGTTGPNRKLVLWQQSANKKRSFTKIAVGTNAAANLQTEAKTLTHLSKQRFQNIKVPALLNASCHSLQQEDIAAAGVRRTHQINCLPPAALQEWLRHDLQKQSLVNTPFWTAIVAALQSVERQADTRIPKDGLADLKRLVQGLSTVETIHLTTAHGDFTPWNLFIRNKALYLIDWELSQPQMPALYDLFHFVYQSNILVSHTGYKQIRLELNALFNQPEWQAFFHRHQLEPLVLEQCYLAYTISYYLNLYSRQTNWHLQVSWLLQTWNEALCFFMNELHTATTRKLMLQQVATLLTGKKYALLKFMSAQLDAVPEDSDVDICMDKKDARTFLKQLKNHPLVAQVTCINRSYMVQASLVLTDGSLLHLDLIWAIKRKALEFVSATGLLNGAVTDDFGNKLPCTEDNFAYTTLFYVLNGAAVPEHYQRYFNELPQAQQALLHKWVKMNFSFIDSFATLYKTDAKQRQQIVQAIKQTSANNGWNGVKNKVWYAIDTLRNLAPRKGFIVTFSGVDGAGKSTVIENTKRHIEKQLRGKVVVLRHRPSLLPILSAYKYGRQQAEQKAAVTLPRQGKNGSQVSSFFRFAYYYSDYVFGQLYIQLRYVWRGYIVLYDRYYFDFINDSRRSNISLPKSFTAWGYRLLLKPRLNFFLYAKPEEILKRKQELDAGTIETLTANYLQLFKKLGGRYRSSKYVPVHNTNLDQTLQLIYQTIKTSRP